MANSWGNSWGSIWGNSWGTQEGRDIFDCEVFDCEVFDTECCDHTMVPGQDDQMGGKPEKQGYKESRGTLYDYVDIEKKKKPKREKLPEVNRPRKKRQKLESLPIPVKLEDGTKIMLTEINKTREALLEMRREEEEFLFLVISTL